MLDIMDLAIYGMKNDKLALQLEWICSFKLWSLKNYLSFSLTLQVWNSPVEVFGVKALVTVQYLISFPPAGVCGLSMIYSLVINQNDNMEERVNWLQS
jgi:hypothetical protein